MLIGMCMGVVILLSIIFTRKNSNNIMHNRLVDSHHSLVELRFKMANDRIKKYQMGALHQGEITNMEIFNKVTNDFATYRNSNLDFISKEHIVNFLETSLIEYGKNSEYFIIACKLLAH